jgi:hypothetical protein
MKKNNSVPKTKKLERLEIGPIYIIPGFITPMIVDRSGTVSSTGLKAYQSSFIIALHLVTMRHTVIIQNNEIAVKPLFMFSDHGSSVRK